MSQHLKCKKQRQIYNLVRFPDSPMPSTLFKNSKPGSGVVRKILLFVMMPCTEMEDKLESETRAKLHIRIIKSGDIWCCTFPRDWLCPNSYWCSRPSSEKPLESPHMLFLPLVRSKESDLQSAESFNHQHRHSVIAYLDYNDI